MSNSENGPAPSGLTASVSLVVSAAIAYAIETGRVGWSWWWLALTGAPFVVYVAALAVALVGLAVGGPALVLWAKRRGRARR